MSIRDFMARVADSRLAPSLPLCDEPKGHDEWKTMRPLFFAIAAMFFLKFAAYALYVTPFWDVPDEVGHYSFVEDLSHGHYPLLGEARLTRNVTDSWMGAGAEPARNWIAQHPPLFYALAAPAVATTRALGGDFSAQVHSARLVSSLIGALAVLGLAAFLTLATGRALLGAAGAIFIGATPMFVQLGSGVTHDTLVACTAAWACYWYVRWLKSGEFPHALACALVAGLCCLSKVTALTLAIPLYFAMAWWLVRAEGDSQWRRVLSRLAILWLVMFLPISLWMARNIVHFHNPLPDASLLQVYPKNPSDMTFFGYMKAYPIWQIVLLSFFALIGWMGTVTGNVVSVQINGLAAALFTAPVLLCAASALLGTSRSLHKWKADRFYVPILAIVAFWACLQLPKYGFATWTCISLFLALVWTGAASLLASFRSRSPHGWLIFTGCVCVLFFSVIYYHHIWESYTQISRVKALHGRYFYTVMPFMALILLWPLRRSWLPAAALTVAVIELVVSDSFFLHYAFEMYGKFS